MKKIIYTIVIFFVFVGQPLAQPGQFVNVVENRLELGDTGQQIWLRGMGIGNYVFDRITDPDTLFMHHDSTLFERFAESGMTAVRFYMRVDAFETSPYTYSDETFEWMATNFRWARQNGIYLNPVAMGVPAAEPGNVSEFWDNEENQQRLKAFWAEFASRFVDETAIGGYDLLNEPTPTESMEQWTNLAQALIDTIRTVDTNHLIILEPLYGISNGWEGDYDNPDDVMFTVDDDNTLYDVHFYRPLEFTQWYRFSPNIPCWPDYRTIFRPHDARWVNGTSWNPSPPEGDTDWQYYEGELFYVDDPDLKIGALNLQVGFCNGTVWFDNVLLTRHNQNGELIDTVFYEAISSTDDWRYAWNNYGAEMVACDTTGYDDSFSLQVNDATLYGGWTTLRSNFEVEQGFAYKASGAIKAEGMPENGFAICRVDFYSNPNGSGLVSWNNNYMRSELDRWVQFGLDNNVPMNIGEFGVDRDLLTSVNGGMRWVGDMLHEMIERDLNFTYHLYDIIHDHEEIFDAFASALNLGATEPEAPVLPLSNFEAKVYPNPTNASAVANFLLLRPSHLEICLFDIIGRETKTISAALYKAGKHSVSVDLSDLPSGTYVLNVDGDRGNLFSQKIILQK